MKNKIQNFYELDAWKKGHELGLEVYKILSNYPDSNLYIVNILNVNDIVNNIC